MQSFFLLLDKTIKLLSHRYYQHKIKGETSSLSLKGYISITSPEKINVGRCCCVNDGVQIHAGGGITFGNNVTISMGAKIITRSYDTSDWVCQCDLDEPEKTHVERPVFLNDHTWIGAGAIILPGVNITGRGVIVSAGTILSKDIDDDFVLV